jgi:hypothetical protein
MDLKEALLAAATRVGFIREVKVLDENGLPIGQTKPECSEGFVRAAALEMPRGLRINAVSPPWVKETMIKFGMDPSPGQAAADVRKRILRRWRGSSKGRSSTRV